MSAAGELMASLPTRHALRALGGAPATWYRRRRGRLQPVRAIRPRPAPPLALTSGECKAILDALNSQRFADCTPYTAWAQLLDEGTYLGSVRTFYRVLAANGQTGERRRQLIHPPHAVPQLVARAPNQVWSWDITRLPSTLKWRSFYLYVLLDIFSRYVVGWLLAEQETAQLAAALIEQTCAKHAIAPDSLTLHSDRGSPMRAKTTAELLADLGVAASFSRPRVSNDNPFSEAQFKTLKYRPDFPDHFPSSDAARAHLHPFFAWYNDRHRHSGIGFMTPAAVHFNRAPAITDSRRHTLHAAYAANPQRFKGRLPTPPIVPDLVTINLPQTTQTTHDLTASPELLTNSFKPVSHSH